MNTLLLQYAHNLAKKNSKNVTPRDEVTLTADANEVSPVISTIASTITAVHIKGFRRVNCLIILYY